MYDVTWNGRGGRVDPACRFQRWPAPHQHISLPARLLVRSNPRILFTLSSYCLSEISWKIFQTTNMALAPKFAGHRLAAAAKSMHTLELCMLSQASPHPSIKATKV